MKKTVILSIVFPLLMISCHSKKIDPAFMGKVERDQLSIVTKVPGTLNQLMVKEGDLVQKGDTLGLLEIPEVDAKKSQAEGAMKSAEAQYQMAVKGATNAQLLQLQNKVNGLKEQFVFAQKSRERLEAMLRDSLIPQQKYDEVYAKFIGAENQYLAAKTELEEARKGARIEQQQMALGQQLQASGAIAEVDAASAGKYLIAPQNMTVETINLRVGELALPGYPIISGYLEDAVYFRFTISEDKLGNLQKMQPVKIKVMYKNSALVNGNITLIKALNSYANIATAYPDFDMQQTLFEVHVRPENPEEVKDLITKTTVSLQIENRK